ncbi:hypothetical protein Oweho_3019 [Owenweeksia hongkongensis DSM 17368]|uniref:PKD domain-containing protein n=1 Tax=Owenweeksia hongkongensis (strain DSM 17368 / CIP 108786 / JCM 12287 / NRRL B-23963 / UST20020801) TaxID=926562 RepID=G8R2G2_OWEHD|nr:gliding motility-associated C-terminal domain-containing protein [Owenweeksia hongkongensis]AEV33974.1 hypothetical protein Oweho_3019 [Owenweeksia hongkongensis DSM 17368]
MIFWGGQETFEQVKPDNVGDTLFMAAQIQDNYPNLYSIMPVEDSTAVYINGQLLDIRDRSYQVDTCWAGDVVITANKPVQVMLTRSAPGIVDTNSPNSSLLSPFTINLAGSNELIKRSVLKPFGGDYGMTYVVALFTPTASTADFTVNGQPLPAGSWQAYATRPGWSHAQIEISDKTHILESTGEGFVGYHYSYMKKTPNYYYMPSYGYCLVESKPVPQDSLSFYIKREEGEKVKFEDFDSPVCVGEQLLVYPPAARHVSWQWSFDDGQDTVQVINEKQGAGFSHSYTIPGTYWIYVNDTAGCSPPDSVKVEVVDSPVADFDYTSQMTCDGLEVQFVNKSQGATKYEWQLPDGEVSNDESPVFLVENSDDLTVSLSVENDAGCSNEIAKNVKPDTQGLNELIVPNVFTPNGDGINDCFYVSGKEGFAECFDLSIYNRWGERVFESTNPEDCWTGEEHSDGTYFYVLRIGKEEFKGHLLLNR